MELHYFGNPAAYQAYALSYNDAGVGNLDLRSLPSDFSFAGDGCFSDPSADPETIPDDVPAAFRRNMINTLTIFGPFEDYPELVMAWQPLGVDLDRVRVLAGTP